MKPERDFGERKFPVYDHTLAQHYTDWPPRGFARNAEDARRIASGSDEMAEGCLPLPKTMILAHSAWFVEGWR